MTRHINSPVSPLRLNTPVQVWAALGILLLAFQTWVLVLWITGPYFHSVESGPDIPPLWMRAILVFWQVITPVAAIYAVWRFVIKPWRRDRTVGTDGLFVLAGFGCWFWDTSSNQAGHWITYNSWMLNRGNWTSSLPWWNAFHEPGADTAMPLLYTPLSYVYLLLAGAALGSWAIRILKRRYPRWPNTIILSMAVVGGACFSLILEGLIWMPMGIFEYPGGHWAIFSDSYHKYPVHEAVFWGLWVAGLGALHYFKNDRGETLAERGIWRIKTSPGIKVALRALAMTAAAQLVLLFCYHLPHTLVGAYSDEWPMDLQQRSYLTGHVCGPTTNRVCGEQ